MDKEGASFNGALKEAQDLGYAERNPEADVEGHDTCRKIAILTAMATKKEVNYQDIHTEGITRELPLSCLDPAAWKGIRYLPGWRL